MAGCQSALAATVASREAFPSTRPSCCQRTLAVFAAPERLPHPPAPGGGAKPQGGWVGETCPSSAALTAKAPWERQAITLALRPLAATCHLRKGLRLPKSASWAHSLPYYWGVCSCQSTLAATVALERLLHPPAPLSVPRHVGRDCCRSEGIPTRPPLFRCQRTLAICAAP